MNVLVVDTSSWISYFAGRTNSDLDLALSEGRAFLSPLVAAELLSGKLSTGQRQDLKAMLNELPLCDHSLEHWYRVGELRAALSVKGLRISTPDAHIAQCALDLDGYLVSEDAIFRRIQRYTEIKLL